MRRLLVLLLILLPVQALAATPEPATIEVLHADMATGPARYEYWVTRDAAPKRRDLVRVTSLPDVRFRHGDRVLVTRSPPTPPTLWTIEPLVTRSALTAVVGGTHRVAVLLVSFWDQGNPTTVGQAEDTAAALAAFYQRASYGRLTLEVDVLPGVRIDLHKGGCNYGTIGSQAEQRATAAGADLSGYQHRIYSFPTSPCPWSGLATVGGSPGKVWYNGGFTFAPLAEHELGHNLGLYHAHADDCGPVPLGPGCSRDEYGDTLDIMGSGLGDPSAAQKRQLGWLTPRPVVHGSMTLAPLETTADALVIERDNASLLIEHRQRAGDAGLPGVLVHIQEPDTGPNGIALLRMSESWVAPALPVGETWTDPVSGIAVRVNAVSLDGAALTITLPDEPPFPGDADVSATFVRVTSAAATFSVDVGPYRCVRQTGGASVVRIFDEHGQLLAAAGVQQAPMNISFVLRCQVHGATVTLSLDGRVRLEVQP